MMNPGLVAAYRMTRQRLARKGFNASPARCLEMARADLERAGHDRFTFYAISDGLGAPGERGGRWIENPAALGFRFVGWSDKLARLDHTGWFLFPDGDPAELARGCVYQLPARNGRPLYVEAIRTGEETRGGWRDMGEEGAALIFPRELYRGDVGEADASRACLEAARGADREAELYAEKEREYQEAWRAGADCAQAEEEAKAERDSARELVRELRTFYRSGFKLPPAACATIRAGLRAHIRDASKAAAKARELRNDWATLSGWRSHLAEAFAEGLGA